MATRPLLYILAPQPRGSAPTAYGVFDGPVELERLPSHLPKGGLVAIRPHPRSGPVDLAEAIEAAAARVTNAGLVLWPDCVGRRRAVELAACTRRLGIRAVVWTAAPSTGALRAQLTDPTDWPEAVVSWVRRRGAGVSPETAALLQRLADHAGGYRALVDLAAEHGPADWRWRRLFKADGIGPVGRWHAVLRAARLGLEIQRNPSLTVAELAYRSGFSASTALSDRLNHVVGARPGYIRNRLGWQWMLADAARRAKILQSGRIGPVRK